MPSFLEGTTESRTSEKHQSFIHVMGDYSAGCVRWGAPTTLGADSLENIVRGSNRVQQ